MKNKPIVLLALFIAIALLGLGCPKPPPPIPPAPPPIEEPIPEPPPPEPTPPPPMEQGKIIKNGARMRAEPTTQSEIILTLNAGALVQILSKEGEWYLVMDENSNQGFIFQNLIKIISPDAKPLPPVAKPKVMLPEKKTYLTIKGANIRPGPGSDYDPPVGGVAENVEFICDGYTGNWYHGTAKNITGWIYKSLLNIDQATGAPQTAEGSSVKEGIYDPFNAIVPATAPGGSETPSGESAASPGDSTAEPTVNPASESTVDSSPQQPAQQPETTEQEPSSDATPQSQSGHASSNGNVGAGASAEPTQTQKPKQGKAKIIASSAVKVRTEPNALAKVIAELEPGSEFMLNEYLGDWSQVQIGSQTGYITSESYQMIE